MSDTPLTDAKQFYANVGEDWHCVVSADDYEALERRAIAAERDAKAVRELMNIYNLGGWTDAEGPMKRALAAESALAEAQAERDRWITAARKDLADVSRELAEARKRIVAWTKRPLQVDSYATGRRLIHAYVTEDTLSIEVTDGSDTWRTMIRAPWLAGTPSAEGERHD